MENRSTEVSRVWEALRGVQEPELHNEMVALQMVKEVAVRDQTVSLTFTLTTPACPFQEEIERSIRDTLRKLDGVRAVERRQPLGVRGGVGDDSPVRERHGAPG